MKSIIVGFGRMGQRYAQVLRDLYGQQLELFIVDPCNRQSEFKHFANIHDLEKDDYDLAIDAHPNKGRLDVLKDLHKIGCSKIIVEKPHAQSIAESKEMLSFCETHSISTMVPFFKRYAPVLQKQIIDKIEAGPLLSVAVATGAIGYGCNGVHLIDWIDQLFSEKPAGVYADIYEESIESPRGEEFKDTAGVLYLKYSEQKSAQINILSNSSHGSAITLSFARGKIVIHEQRGMSWRWYRQEDTSLPFYRTHTDKEISPSMPYQLNLIEMMKTGIKEFVEGETTAPSLKDGHNVLKTLALAHLSSKNKTFMPWDTVDSELSCNFSFT